MSHVVTIEVQFRDMPCLAKAVQDMGGSILGQASHKLYERSVDGIGYKLPGWVYPIVLQADGKLAYDDYHGSWGNPADLKRLKQGYSLQVAKRQALKAGFRVLGQSTKNDGTVVLRVGR